jgi:dienelactone hydrolase
MRNHLFIVILGLLLVSACVQPATVVDTAVLTTETPTSPAPIDTATSLPPTETLTPLPPTITLTPQPSATATEISTPTLDIPTELVEVPYEDRVIRGTLMGDGDIVVILAPMWGENRSSWLKFAKHIAPLGYSALAIDFPGAGASSGEFSFTKVNFDVVAVIDYLQALGYEQIVCMGASLGASACFEAALLRPELAGLVIVAGPPETTSEEAATLLMPKLLVVGDEPDVKSAMSKDYQILPMPKEFKTLEDTAHGTDMLNTGSREEFSNILVEFLETLP